MPLLPEDGAKDSEVISRDELFLIRTAMPNPKTLSPDARAALLDVELLDIMAQIECLLRNAREVQRQSLRVRGVPSAVTSGQRRQAADKIHAHVQAMVTDATALRDVLKRLEGLAKTLEP